MSKKDVKNKLKLKMFCTWPTQNQLNRHFRAPNTKKKRFSTNLWVWKGKANNSDFSTDTSYYHDTSCDGHFYTLKNFFSCGTFSVSKMSDIRLVETEVSLVSKCIFIVRKNQHNISKCAHSDSYAIFPDAFCFIQPTVSDWNSECLSFLPKLVTKTVAGTFCNMDFD